MLALRFAFAGGSAQDPVGKEGLANFVATALGQTGGNLTSLEFCERIDDLAISISISAGKDALVGSLAALSECRGEATQALRSALTRPSVEPETVDRVRRRLLSLVAIIQGSPRQVANARWDALAFEGHPYAQPIQGNEVSVGSIDSADIEAYRQRVLAKDGLMVVAVGDVTRDELGALLDDAFGHLPAHADLTPIGKASAITGGRQAVIEMDTPQSVAVFGLGAMSRRDPDFMAAFVLNQIIGGDGRASKLVEELRTRRGLANKVSTDLIPLREASVFKGRIALQNHMTVRSLDIICSELQKLADGQLSQSDLDDAKSYLIGSFPLRFDTNAKIARHLLDIQMEGFGPDYFYSRNAMIKAVTLENLKRVAKQFLKVDNIICAIAGKA